VTSRLERVLLVATPLGAMATVALGLRVGAGSAVRAAVVYGAPRSAAGTGLAWQVVVFDEDHGVRAPVPGMALDVTARGDGADDAPSPPGGKSAGVQAHWHGVTSEDGAAEVLLSIDGPALHLPALHLEVRAGEALLAEGDVTEPAALPRHLPAASWASFARRAGEVRLDVAVPGQRVATGFPTSLWVRATDATTHTPLAGVTVEPERDSSFLPAAARVTTDARGWAHIVATPVGHAVGVVLHATTPGGGAGEWAGGLYVSPGAAALALADRVAPGEETVIDVVVPTLRTTAYLEVDDALGRAWAAAVPVRGDAGEMPRARVRVPPLAPGLYWAVEAGDPSGASKLGPGSAARPFFVAASDDAALAFGTDPGTCVPPADPRDTARVVSACLALAGATPVPRWTALDGFIPRHGRNAEMRRRGLAIALGALLVAVILETLLVLRASLSARARLQKAIDEGREECGASEEGEPRSERGQQGDRSGERGDRNDASHRGVGPAWTLGIALLVALMGFALMAAFLARVG
jgi:hypothetical protein